LAPRAAARAAGRGAAGEREPDIGESD